MMNWVRTLEGRSGEGRQASISAVLDSLEVPFHLMPFDSAITRQGWTRHIRGTNILVRMGPAPPTLVVGAHYDAVETSPGANDNGGGVAVLLMLLAKLRDHPWTTGVECVFFDQEEVGLVGSAVYVDRALQAVHHRAMVNLDVVGTGEVLYVGPVGGGDDDFVMGAVRRTAEREGLTLDERERYPGSDHLSFARRGLENISVSVMPVGVTDQLDGMMQGSPPVEEDLPEVLAVMHTPRDSSTRMSGSALQKAYTLVRGVLLDLEAR